MPGPITNKEAEKLLGTRLEHYRLAVLAGFYNEGPATQVYKGFQIVPVPADHTYLIMQHGVTLLTVKAVHIAKIWVTCRLQRVGVVEANAIIKEENSA
jgi:hypothetical protein